MVAAGYLPNNPSPKYCSRVTHKRRASPALFASATRLGRAGLERELNATGVKVKNLTPRTKGRKIATAGEEAGRPAVGSTFRHSTRSESALKRIADASVDTQQRLSGDRHRTNAHDRNQRGDQAIFNGGDTGFILEETSNSVLRPQLLS
jgi:hypothetical protein